MAMHVRELPVSITDTPLSLLDSRKLQGIKMFRFSYVFYQIRFFHRSILHKGVTTVYTNIMDNLSKSSLNFLTSAGIDRMPTVRVENYDLSEMISSAQARFVPVQGDKNLLKEDNAVDPLFLTFEEMKKLPLNEENCFLLGRHDDLVYFTIDIDNVDSIFTPPEGSTFTNLRKSRLNVKNWKGALLAYANALISWQRNHRFCGKCGSATRGAELGQARFCTNNLCGAPHYPRTDPAIIVAVTSGDKCLMARKDGWPEEMYSVVAGYVDHGESLEDTVVREVFEETGIRVKSVHYHSSQPWPFPYTLMLGYFAEAENEDIQIDKHELEEARWFTREEIVEGLKAGTHKLPTVFSISRKLITDWFNQGDMGKLEDYL